MSAATGMRPVYLRRRAHQRVLEVDEDHPALLVHQDVAVLQVEVAQNRLVVLRVQQLEHAVDLVLDEVDAHTLELLSLACTSHTAHAHTDLLHAVAPV